MKKMKQKKKKIVVVVVVVMMVVVITGYHYAHTVDVYPENAYSPSRSLNDRSWWAFGSNNWKCGKYTYEKYHFPYCSIYRGFCNNSTNILILPYLLISHVICYVPLWGWWYAQMMSSVKLPCPKEICHCSERRSYCEDQLQENVIKLLCGFYGDFPLNFLQGDR